MPHPDPQSRMSQLLGGYRVTQMLHVAAALGIADRLADGPASVDQLALATNAHRDSLYRLLRSLASMDVFVEQAPGHFANTPLASTLRKEARGSLRPFALSYGAPWWWNSFGELLHSVRTGETGFSKANGTAFFDYLESHPDAARVFNDNMSAMTRVEAEAVADAYDFANARVFVDIGGGHGVLAAAILRRWPKTSAVVFDQPSVVAGASEITASPSLGARCRITGGDFFAAIPCGGDVYLLKDILHDWDDERVKSILKNCRAAMSPGARLLVVERIVAPGNAPSAAKQVDITMLVLTGGKERTRDEYAGLLGACGFAIARIIEMPTGGSVIEANVP